LRFLDEIGGDIDFALLDTMHTNPGEILDFLMILPFLRDDATIVFHDTQLHLYMSKELNGWTFTNCLLMSAIYGEKIIPEYLSKNNNGKQHFPNIGAVKINSDTKKRVFDIFNLLTIRWVHYIPGDDDLQEILAFFARYYDSRFIEYLKEVIIHQKTNINNYSDKMILEEKKALEERVNRYESSNSWKLTKPLSDIMNIIRQIKRRP
jgi:hypothetical protein